MMDNHSKNVAAVKGVVHTEGRGLTRKEILRRLPLCTPAKDVDLAIAELVADGALTRSGGVGAGYRYWPGN